MARGLGIVAAVLLSVGSLLSIGDGCGPPSPISVASAEIQRSVANTPRYSSKSIRDIQSIADRVLADNPETPGQAPSDFGEFDRESWRIVQLEVPKPDGEWMRVTLARPLTWLEAAGRDDHGRLWLEFKELGIAKWANVLAIEPCTEAAVGEGRLVTGKFEHSSADVIDLFVDGVSEPIGTTSNHPFWSEDRRDFVQAGQLRMGERLRLRDGTTPVVTAAVAKSQSVPVFNVEVDGEHVYYVAANGVLVHNAESYITEHEAIVLARRRIIAQETPPHRAIHHTNNRYCIRRQHLSAKQPRHHKRSQKTKQQLDCRSKCVASVSKPGCVPVFAPHLSSI